MFPIIATAFSEEGGQLQFFHVLKPTLAETFNHQAETVRGLYAY
jgi:hypothetical protein